MIYALLKLAHVLGVILWVGGMLFAHFFLRPAVQALEPPQRLRLLHDVLRRFFAAAGVAVLFVVGAGLAMIGQLSAGGGFRMPLPWLLMSGLGLLMAAIFVYIRFLLFPRLRRAVEAGDWKAGGAAMTPIRGWVLANLVIGLVVVVIAVVGPKL